MKMFNVNKFLGNKKNNINPINKILNVQKKIKIHNKFNKIFNDKQSKNMAVMEYNKNTVQNFNRSIEPGNRLKGRSDNVFLLFTAHNQFSDSGDWEIGVGDSTNGPYRWKRMGEYYNKEDKNRLINQARKKYGKNLKIEED